MTIDFYFCTDGDFCLDRKYFEKLLVCHCYDCSSDYQYRQDGEWFSITFEVKFEREPDDRELREMMLARDVTEAVVKSIRFHHMFLMRYLYELSEKVTHWAFYEKDKLVFHESWSGNYDGTEFIITR